MYAKYHRHYSTYQRHCTARSHRCRNEIAHRCSVSCTADITRPRCTDVRHSQSMFENISGTSQRHGATHFLRSRDVSGLCEWSFHQITLSEL